MNNPIFSLIADANNLIRGYCISACRAKCCKKDFLVITESEMKKISAANKKVLEDNSQKIRKRFGGGYLLDINKGCCFLDNGNKCIIYSSRPDVCLHAPFVIDEEMKIIKAASACPAVNKRMLDKTFEEFEKLGWKVFLCEEGKIGVKLKRRASH